MNLTGALTYMLISVVTAAIIWVVRQHVTYDMGDAREIKLFRYFLMSFMAFVLSNAVCIWTNYFFIRVAGTIFTTINLIALCTTAYFWFSFINVRLNPQREYKQAYRFAISIPLLIVIIMIATSFLTHFIFYYNEKGEFCRGPFYAVILVAAFFYIIVATVQAYRSMRKAKTRAQKSQSRNLMIFIIFPFLAGVIDFIYAHLPSMETVILFGIILIYLNLQHAQLYRDALTGLNNRRLTDEYLRERIAFVSDEAPLYFFMADINEFKSINDRFGHLEGDNALKMVAAVLKKYSDIDHYFVSRLGGDEFVMIVDQDSTFDPDAFKKTVNDDIRDAAVAQNKEYDISLSIGYVKCTDPNMKNDDILNTADKYMYAEKRAVIDA